MRQDIGARRIADMDSTGVAMHVLSLTSPGVQVFDAATAVSFAKDCNDQLAAAIKKHPTRFAGLAAIAPQDPKEAARLWKLAAGQGQPFAQVKLGAAYIKGKGVQSSIVEGYAWMAASDVPDAQPLLREMEKRMPAPLLEKAKRLADERRALRGAKSPKKS